ncbi:MAG: non-homologous end-joining DNA ligase [Gemmatimonadota bacterium]
MITHPEKVLFPDSGITKGELADYYRLVADLIVPHLAGRPVTMERFPRGIGEKGFIQKNVARGFPAWLERVEVPKEGGTVNYPLVNDVRSLMWVINQNTITPHVWTSRIPSLMEPDICVIDLDPSVDDHKVLTSVALQVRELLKELGLESHVKTSGSRGFHIVIPLASRTTFGESGRFSEALASELVRRDPRNLTLEFSKADRGSRILVDVLRNRPGATFASAYAVRPRPGAPVSAPVTWDEVKAGVHPTDFTLRSMVERLASVGDLWSGLYDRGQRLESALDRLRRGSAR